MGLTRIFYDTAGTRLSPTGVVRQSPILTAVDGGNTSFFGSDDSDPDTFPNFYGTSAAAPDAAAVAALMLQRNSTLTPAQIRTILSSTAVDMNAPGTDRESGAGLIDAFGALGATPVFSPGSISINDVSLTEGNAGTALMTFTVTRTGGTGGAFDVNFATANGSATTADADYAANSGTLNFGAGVNTQTVSVTINGDTKFELSENFFVNLSGATNGATIADNQALGTIINDDAAPATPPPHDFNGDGLSDILWRNVSGQLGEWQMSGATVNTVADLGFVGTDWHVAEIGDFGGGGIADILWRNDSGQVGLWQLNGGQVLSTHDLGFVGNDWHIAEAADFSGDGKSDILWRNDNGQIGLWRMDGGLVLSTQSLGTVGNDWHIVDGADFDGDGKVDILWRNDTGQVGLWLMDGTQLLAAETVAFVGNDWHIAGVGDFGGDGKADILWRNDTGEVGEWQMNGAQTLSVDSLGTPGRDWHIADTGDYNGDAQSEILWRNDNGQVGLWTMDGAQLLAAQTVAFVGNDWAIAAHRYDYI